MFSALTACWSEIIRIVFFAALTSRFNVPIAVTLRAEADSLNSMTIKFVVKFSKRAWIEHLLASDCVCGNRWCRVDSGPRSKRLETYDANDRLDLERFCDHDVGDGVVCRPLCKFDVHGGRRPCMVCRLGSCALSADGRFRIKTARHSRLGVVYLVSHAAGFGLAFDCLKTSGV